MSRLWEQLSRRGVERFYPQGAIPLTLDDTAFHKSGRKIEGAGWWRDAVRSTGQRVVHCFGLNLAVLCLRIDPPWGGEPLSLPINARLHHTGEERLLDLAEAMIREVAQWFPGRTLQLSADGFFATLAGQKVPNTHLTSRMRRDAAIYTAPPQRRPGQFGICATVILMLIRYALTLALSRWERGQMKSGDGAPFHSGTSPLPARSANWPLRKTSRASQL